MISALNGDLLHPPFVQESESTLLQTSLGAASSSLHIVLPHCQQDDNQS